ncbi:hypothetical protein BGZ73_006192 [Actinomortierella ambigua]|nr:hypothetical protein BGZ73_006192 [Actinomortierella ambigua]
MASMTTGNISQHQQQGCLGFSKDQPCNQGAVSLYAVNASSVADVQATIRFASQHNIRLIVKNTGHDFLGRSSGAHSLSLWTHYMKDLSMADNFIPEGAPAVPFADSDDRGGYCIGGGYSPLSRLHGLCVDNVLQYKVVTPDGELKVANMYRNQELFWALRGGGPGFGVIVEAVYRTFPELDNGVAYSTAYIVTTCKESRKRVIRTILGFQRQWSDEGWTGASYVQGPLIAMVYVLPGATAEEAKSKFDRLLNEIRPIGGITITVDNDFHDSFLSVFNAYKPVSRDSLAGVNRLVGSRLVPQSTFDDSSILDKLADTLSEVEDDISDKNGGFFDQVADTIGGLTRGYLIDLTAGGQVMNNDPDGSETSVTPAWRKALILMLVVIDWHHNEALSPKDQHQQLIDNQNALTRSIERLAKLTPGSGAYFNEADPNEPDWQNSFWGEENYRRLYKIKQQVDKNGLFVCRRCVGSEDWDEELMCRRAS